MVTVASFLPSPMLHQASLPQTMSLHPSHLEANTVQGQPPTTRLMLLRAQTHTPVGKPKHLACEGSLPLTLPTLRGKEAPTGPGPPLQTWQEGHQREMRSHPMCVVCPVSLLNSVSLLPISSSLPRCPSQYVGLSSAIIR